MTNELKVGDVVVLKSVGPKMTIQANNLGMFQCVWFVGTEMKSGAFAPEALRLATDDDE